MGFLLLSKGCIPGPHDFPTLGAWGRMSLPLSPPCLPLCVPWAAWVYTCLPLVSHSGCQDCKDWNDAGHATNRFHQFFLPASWICTAALENWKYLTCNKQVPAVFCLQVESVLLLWKAENIWHATNRFQQFSVLRLWKTENIWHATNRFQQFFCLQVESVLLLWKTENIWHATNRFQQFLFSCRLNLYCYCGKLKVFDMQQTNQ